MSHATLVFASSARVLPRARLDRRVVASRSRSAGARSARVVRVSDGKRPTSLGASGAPSRLVVVRGVDAEADAETASAPPSAAERGATEGYAKLDGVLGSIRDLPPSERGDAAEAATKDVSAALNGMKAAGAVQRWDCYPELQRRNIFPNELAQMGVKDASAIARPSDANDFNFIVAVVMSTSFLALVVGVVLPGDWGAFGSYLIGGISLAVLAVGSTAPGLLAVAIDRFARIDPSYRDRIARHEAAHFLVGYMLGTPVAGYSLGLGTAHTDFLEAKLERKVYGRIAIKESTMLPLACISMAGVAAEAMAFEDVRGQEADLRDLQRILNKCEPKLGDQAQQQLTRWAVWQSASMLKRHEKAFEALVEAMKGGASVPECLRAIENAPETTGE
jgi:hypothetical protein